MKLSFLHIDNNQLQRIATGDEQAFRQLFEQNWGQVYGVAFAFMKSEAIAEEVVQDIFLKIWLKKEQLIDVEKPVSYLSAFIRNHILNELRKKTKEETFRKRLLEYFQQQNYSPEEQLLLKESESIINAAVSTLPPRQQLIYKLSRQQGLTQDDIAHQLHISKNTVKSHMNKALHAIRNYIRPYAGEITFFLLVLIEPVFL